MRPLCVALPDLLLYPVYPFENYTDSIRTSQLKGRKILLTFNRYVSCPLCNFHTHTLLSHYDTLKQNRVVIISIYESGKEILTQYATKEEIPFIMISDPHEFFYKQFNVTASWWKTFAGFFHAYRGKHAEGKKKFKAVYKRDGRLNRIEADFLVDENGVIQTAYYGKFVGDHLSVDTIMKWVRKK